MDLKLPQLGEDIDEATVLKVLVSEGTKIDQEQSVIEVETDKASLEVPSTAAGTIESIEVSEGDTIKVGDTIAKIAESEGRDDENGAKEEEGRKAADDAGGEGASGDEDEQEQETEEKREPKGRADESGDDKESGEEEGERETEEERKPEGDQQEEGGSKKETEPGAEKDADTSDADEDRAAASPSAAPSSGGLPVFASPSVRRFAREIGVELSRVEGSGPGGRISIEDVKKHARASRREADQGAASGPISQPLPDLSRWGEIESSEMNAIRRVTAERMSASWSAVPHVTLFEKADMTDLDAARARFSEEVEKESGARLSVTAILLKVVAAVLADHPGLAASVDMRERRIVRRHYVHLGVAVDTPEGLLVPVLRDVDHKPLASIAKELEDVAGKARGGQLDNEDLRGGVFTVTNLGGLGTGFFTPLVNPPEGAILGVGRARTEPVWEAEEEHFVPRMLLPLSLSFDHRLVDGADAARFLHGLVSSIEDPYRLALNLDSHRERSG